MNDIARWLDHHGLGKYAEVFAENEIDFRALHRLTEDDLKELGLPLGARRSFQAALEQTTEQGGASVQPHPQGSRSTAPAREAERRQLTVMFADLAGSTELSQQLDPEELRGVNRAYQDAAKAAIEKYGGYVARYMGDGVLAYFGYPQAHEDDAERAVRSGLEMTHEVPKLAAAGTKLAVRVGIATGAVVVGDLIGHGASQESAVVGEAPNLAARLQGAAKPNTVTISDATHALVQGFFDCAALGAVQLKGFSEEQRLWRVDDFRRTESRFEALRDTGLTPFVGRSSELQLLLERWETAIGGQGQVVLLEGEPGVGKSRLVDEFRRSIFSTPHRSIRYQCSPHHQNAPFYPFISQLQHAAEIQPQDISSKRLDKLEAMLAETTPDRSKLLSLFAALLSLPTDRYPPLSLEPKEVKSETIKAFQKRLSILCRMGTVLVVFEDAHWIDPTSLEVLGALVEVGHRLPVLVLVSHRPEFVSPWYALESVTALPLNRLARSEGSAIIREVAKGKHLPEEVSEHILAKTDGVALFVEELTKTILESGLLREEGTRYTLDGALSEVAIPSTLHDSLMARLDRLGEVKVIAQIGACIGREFTYPLLQTISGVPNSGLRRSLEKLIESELVSGRGVVPDSTYTFKHALVQDAAYGSLLLARRRTIHSSIVAALEDTYQGSLGGIVELLAHHSQRAELWDKAVAYLRQAGAKAYGRSAGRESVVYYEQALAALERMSATAEAETLGIDIRLELRNSVFVFGDIEGSLRREREAESIARAIDDHPRRGKALALMSNSLWMMGDSVEAHTLARDALSIGESLDDDWLTTVASYYLGAAALTLGDYGETELGFTMALKSIGTEFTNERFGMPGYPGAIAHSCLAWAYGDCGRFEEGIAHGCEGLRVADRIGQPYTQTWSRYGLAQLYGILGNQKAALELVEAATEISSAAGLRAWETFLGCMRGDIYSRSGRAAEGVSLMRDALGAREVLGLRNWNSLFGTQLGEGLLAAGQLDQAHAAASKALSLAREWRERGHEAHALRLLGAVAGQRESPDTESAETHYREALHLADELGMRPLVAHCHYGLGKVYQGRGTQWVEQANEHLAGAMARYREMGMQLPSS